MFGYTSFLYLCQLAFVLSELNDTGELVFTIMLYRHGDRMPIYTYPKDPYNNNSLWPAPWGELSKRGKQGHYELGKWLRNRYKDFLPEQYNKFDIHVQSTDVDRTLMSAYSNLAGLYEPKKDSNWNPNIDWTPIPVHTIPQKLDKVLAAEFPCPKYDKDQERIMNSGTFKKINGKYKKLYEFLSANSGLNVTDVWVVSELYDIFLIEEIYNFTLPQWAKTVYPQPLRDLSALSFAIPCFTRTSARLKMGPLFSEILQNMQKKISGNLTQKAWMYSGHDTTIANILQSLGMFYPYHCPPYLSLILFELTKRNNEYFVSMYYRNSSSVPLYLLKIPGCEKFCPIKKFSRILSNVIPENWERECEETKFVQRVFDKTTSISLITVLSLSLIFFLSLAVILKFYRSQNWNQSDFAYSILKMDAT